VSESIHRELFADNRAIVVGCPPAYRGGTTKGTDLELTLIKYFPTVPYFIEKVQVI
jgi:hypothetical protein